MREIEKDMLAAIRRGADWKSGNTQVKVSSRGVVKVYLHDNLIALRGKNDDWHFSSCGWETHTTKSRLNALGANITQRNYTWYRNGKEFKCEDLEQMAFDAAVGRRYSWKEVA